MLEIKPWQSIIPQASIGHLQDALIKVNRDSGPLIEVDGVTRFYGKYCAVDNLKLVVNSGEVLGLLGPNGAGKSTTLAMLAGTLAPHRGRVRIDGFDLADHPGAAKARIGYLPETAPLVPEQTVDEFLSFCGRLRGMAASELTERREAVKQRCGLTEVGRRQIAKLSKGFQQRLGIAQAVLHAPPVLIFDEPTVGLDPIQIREIRALILTLGSDHAIILSTHILAEVQTVCDRVALIHKGHLILDKPLADLGNMPGRARTRVRFQRPPPRHDIAALNGIVDVQQHADQQFTMSHEPDPTVIEAVVRAAYERDWGLLELSPASDTLETLFVKLTCGEEEEVAQQ